MKCTSSMHFFIFNYAHMIQEFFALELSLQSTSSPKIVFAAIYFYHVQGIKLQLQINRISPTWK